MRTLTHTVAGDECQIHVVETRADLATFEAFLSDGDPVLAFDTETTGLDIYAPSFRVRLVQVGNGREAFILDAQRFGNAIRRAFMQPRKFVAHNATYDLLVLDRHLDVPLEALAERTFDTRILAHLLDPRTEAEGGTGHGLKPLSAIYVDPNAPDTQAGLVAVFRSHGLTKQTGWAGIPLDDETYLRYAGLDVLLDHRLFYALAPIVKELGLNGLSTFEHHLSGLIAMMQRKGMRLDLDYVRGLDSELADEAAQARQTAAQYGVENVNSTTQVAEALLGMGESLPETTPSGATKVDKQVLLPLADLDNGWQRRNARDPNPLATAVLLAKRSEKWRTAYVEQFQTLADSDGRLHPFISSLAARTARMSVSRPALQQLPASDATIRRAIVADPGMQMVSADYSQIELRVLAALADVKGMKEAITSGQDLHDFTARLVYGDNFTKFQRGLMKGVGFGKVYGGGAATLSRQTGADFDAVKRAIAEYDRVYPEVRRYGRKLQQRAEYGRKEVVTASGRHLPLDRDRLYAATNYVVQSTARDILAQAIVDLFDAGLGDHLLLPIHDEILAQAPEAEAEDFAQELGRIMSGSFGGVPLLAEGEVIGRNWGAAYGADPAAGL